MEICSIFKAIENIAKFVGIHWLNGNAPTDMIDEIIVLGSRIGAHIYDCNKQPEEKKELSQENQKEMPPPPASDSSHDNHQNGN